jgi:hypothetical protein
VGISLVSGQSTGVTYGGTALTLVGRYTGSHSHTSEIWRLLAPTVATANIVASFNSSVDAIGGGVAFDGVDQSTPTGTLVGASADNSSPSRTVTSATGEVVIDVLFVDQNTTATAGAGQTERWDQTNNRTGAGSTEAGASSVTMSWTLGTADEWNLAAVPIKPVSYSISGNVFEDVNYGGGAGRSKASSSGVGRQYADVELYNSSGVYVSGTNTDANGDYSITGLAAGTYYVRVVNDSVRSSRSGWTTSCKPVMTYRTNAASGTAVAVTDYVGGTNPSASDPGIGSAGATFNTTTFVYTAVLTGTAQAVTQCVITSANITGVDFGFNYNTVANTNNSGQGSLRQFITNANTLGGDASLAQSGLTAAKENAVFMISNGTSAAGLRSANNYFSSGVATITPTSSALTTISTLILIDAQKQPGWTSTPVIRVTGGSAGAGADGFLFNSTSDGSVLRGFMITNFTDDGIDIQSNADNITIAGNWIGTTGTGIMGTGNTDMGIQLSGQTATIGGTNASDRNVITNNGDDGMSINGSGTTSHVIQGNYIGLDPDGGTGVGNTDVGIGIITGAGNTIGGTSAGAGNVISKNIEGIEVNTANNTFQGNKIGTDAGGTLNKGNGSDGIQIQGSITGTTVGGTANGAGNIIAFNALDGVNIVNGTAHTVLGNSIFSNSGLGIDIGSSGVLANNGTKNAGLPNYDMDHPVFTSATYDGTTLAVAGYVGSAPSQSTFANAIVEIFKSSDDASGNGEGQIYLGRDTCDANGNFSGSITTASIAAGNKVTGTATDAGNNTSEFGANYTVTAAYNISGNVFEDVNYGGGAGRSKASSSGVGRQYADVELYNSSGVYVSGTNTDASGNYSFTGLAAGTYYIRVVNDSVRSSRTGWSTSCKPVMTYRTNAASGTAVAVTDYVGGTNPSASDPGIGSAGATFNTTTFVYTAVLTGTAQAVTQCVIGAANITGVDFGFNYNTIVNTNNSGQGSLRQAITNMNTLTGDASLAQSGLVAAKDNAVFMISNGTSAAGLRSSNNYFSSGIATISPTSALTTISTAMVLDAQKQPGWSSAPIIELNGTSAGAGVNGLYVTGGSTIIRGFVINRFTSDGIDLATSGSDTVQGCYIGLNAAGTAASANSEKGIRATAITNLLVGGTSATQRNVVSGNTQQGMYFDNVDNSTIAGNYVGTDAAGTGDINGTTANFAQSGVMLTNGSSNNVVGGTTAGARNVMSGNNHYGFEILWSGSQNNLLQGNYIGTTYTGLAALGNVNGGAITWGSGAGNVFGGSVAARNVISGNGYYGAVAGNASTGTTIQSNYIGVGADGVTALGNGIDGISVQGASTSSTIGGTAADAGNTVAYNSGAGIAIEDASTAGVAVFRNITYSNSSIGIDLLDDGFTANDGAKTAGQPNLLMDHPVFTSAVLVGSTLTFSGYVGTAPNDADFANAIVEIFKSDNDASGYGEGQTYLGRDTCDASGNFSGSFTVAGLNVGDKITGTATDGSNNTSEFGANYTVTAYSISGNIFEDVNYGGGAGRSKAASSGVSVQYADVELYNSSGIYVSGTNTDASGNYSFTGLAAGTYYVRVVNDSVRSSRTGWSTSCKPVMTYRTNAASGTAVAVTDYVGGTNPSASDPGVGSSGATFNTTTFVYTAVLSGTAQAVTQCVISSASITGVDFGFNYNTISNTNDAGQGSLRQLITNANTLGGDASLAQSGLVAGKDNAVFMISNGTAAAGLRSANNYFSSGVATISPTSALTTISTAMVLDAQKQPGWSSAPIIELNGTSAGAGVNGLYVTGGSTILRGFVINRFTNHGIYLITSGADTVQGNYVGTNAAGTAVSANTIHGIFALSIANNLIGGTTAAARNVVSGNNYGIVIAGASATGNTVSGNYVGVNAAGTAPLPNSLGVDIEAAATGNTVGGTSSAERNVISGNTQMGVLLQNAGTSSNTVAGNYIGTNAAGSAAVPNGTFGVNIKGSATNNTIGGTTGTSGNVISGNTQSGIAIEGAAASGNVVQGNYIGLNPAGTAAIANVLHGVYVVDAPSNTIGGTTASARNIISGNSSSGVYVLGATATSNSVKGNYIGTNAAGTAAIANAGNGVLVEAAGAGNTIGGTTAGSTNVISGNVNHGVWLYSSTTGTTMQGNYIGTNASGTAPIANQVHGLTISGGTTSNTIGGTTAAARNVISGNSFAGVRLQGVTTSGNTIQGNYIGVDVNGSAALGNGTYGLYVEATNTSVGGTAAGAGNVIANNGSDGVAVVNTSLGNSILCNSTYANVGLGIDLVDDGVSNNNGTKNAALPNYEMDFPVFTSAVLNGTSLRVIGYVGSAPSQSTFGSARVELFKSSNDASGNGEGQTYLTYITAHSDGNFDTTVTVSGLSVGDKVTATATDASNNTSEFGANYTVTGIYYSKGNLAVNTPSNWNTARDGSGTDASSFGTGNTFVIQNAHAMTLTGSNTWNVSTSGTVQIESGGSWTNSSTGTVTANLLQVDNGGTYTHGANAVIPGTTKSFGATSTVVYSGGTQTVEGLTYGNLTFSGFGTRTLGANASVAGNLNISGGVFDLGTYTANRSSAGGTLTVADAATLKIGGTNSFPTNYSTVSLGTISMVEYNGSNQSVAAHTYGNLTLSNGGTKTAAGGLTTAGSLIIGASTTFAGGSYTHSIQLNWANSGTFTAGTSTVQFTGSSDALISGATTFNTLVVNKSASTNTLTLSSSVSTQTLTMTQGNISTGSNAITVTSDRTGNGLVIGTITRTHTFNASTAYAFEGPYQTLTFASGGTLPTSVTVTTTLSSPGANDYMDPITRYYDISQTGGTGFSYTLRLHYEDSEVSAPNSETSPPLKIWRRTSTGPDVWTRLGATSNNTTNNWVEQTGLTNIGTFSLSSRTVADVTLSLAQNATNPSPGDQVTYTLNYSNDGDGTSTNTVVTASAPTNTSYVAGQTRLNGVLKTDAADADEVTVSGATITINLGTVGVGGSGTITYKVVVN